MFRPVHLVRHAAAIVALSMLMSPNGFAQNKDSLKQNNRAPGRASAMTMADPIGSFAPMLATVIPAVVTVLVVGETKVAVDLPPRGADGQAAAFPAIKTEPFRAGGSGIIIDAARGHVLTNHHVIESAVRIEISMSDGRRFPARVVGSDPATDVAVIEIEGKGFPALPFGDSDQLRVGDVVAAVGNPYGLEGTATLGIISATMRTEVGHGAFEDFLQIDAAINPGNSGGALVNVRGELVGINTVGPKEPGKATGIGFAIPINMARQITSEIVTHGRIRRGSPGLIVEDLTRGLMASLKTSTTRGAHIIEVVANSSAAGLGIKPGGIIVKVSGKPVRGAAEFHTRVETVPVGTKVPAVIEIDGQAREFMLVVGPLVMKPAESTLTQNLGSLAGAVVSDIALGNPLFGNLRGAQVLRVPKTAPAYATGIEAGDVIVGLDGAAINSASDLASLADRAGMLFRVKILRDGNPAWVRVSR